MIQVCDDCFDEFEADSDDQTICPNCLCEEVCDSDRPGEAYGYTKEQCVHIFKCFCSGGFESEEQIKAYQTVKKAYKKLSGRELFKINEKVGKRK